MIIQKFLLTRTDGVNLYKTYSDQNVYIQEINSGVKYCYAIDIEGANHTYIETDIQLPNPPPSLLNKHKEIEEPNYGTSKENN